MYTYLYKELYRIISTYSYVTCGCYITSFRVGYGEASAYVSYVASLSHVLNFLKDQLE